MIICFYTSDSRVRALVQQIHANWLVSFYSDTYQNGKYKHNIRLLDLTTYILNVFNMITVYTYIPLSLFSLLYLQKAVEGIMIWVEWQATVMGNTADVWLYVLEAKMQYNSCSP